LKNTRKTECGANLFPTTLDVRATPFALLKNARKTECGANLFPTSLEVRAIPFPLLSPGRRSILCRFPPARSPGHVHGSCDIINSFKMELTRLSGLQSFRIHGVSRRQTAQNAHHFLSGFGLQIG
jgi:hypothetical protein